MKTEIVTREMMAKFQAEAKELGFLNMSAAPAGPVKKGQTVLDWVAQGNHAEMHWYARSLEKRLDPRNVVPGAQSVVMLTIAYHHEPCTLGGYALARYACGDDYHDVVLKRLRQLGDRIHEAFPESNYRAYVDTGPVLERYWAEQAGLGWIGKNGNLISREHGSYLFLASMVSTLRFPYAQPHDEFCGNCRACLDVCPTDAFVSEGVVDSRKCISYLNIEHRGPFEQAPDFDGWIFGCDLCQEVCPWTTKFSKGPVLPELAPRPAYESLEADAIAAMEQTDFSTTFRKSPIKRTKMAGLKRNLEHLEHTGD